MPICRLLASAALALVASGVARAAEPVAVVGGPGDQTAPSLSDNRLAYVDDASGERQVWIRDLDTGEALLASPGATDVGNPDLDRTTVLFTSAEGVHLVTVGPAGGRTFVPATGAARASLSSLLAAWEQAGPGGRDVALLAPDAAVPLVLAGAGDEHAPSVAFGWVAWLDSAGSGAIRLRDTAGAVRTVWTGSAEKVSLWAASRLVPPILAASVVGAAGDHDLVVLDADGTERARLPLAGAQRNPTLSGEWVGFEDFATGVSQVGVWQWSTGRVLYPAPTGGEQRLNDVTVDGTDLRVAWADGRAGDLDVYLFHASLPLPDVPPGEARCDDPLAQVVADLAIGTGRKRAAAGAIAFGVAKASPVLVCVDGFKVKAAWVKVGETTIVLPVEAGGGHHGGGGHGHDHDKGHDRDKDHDRDEDHDHDKGHDHHRAGGAACVPKVGPPTLRHAEARLTLPAGPACVAALMLGERGATLRARVLADGWTTPARTACLAGVDCPPAPPAAGAAAPPGGGCASGGAAGLLGLAAPALLLAGRRRRARRGAESTRPC